MVESISEFKGMTEEPKPESRKVSLTKTIRFNESESELWEIWDKDLVKKVKTFIREQFTYQQEIRSHLNKSDDSISEKKKLMRKKMETPNNLNKQPSF